MFEKISKKVVGLATGDKKQLIIAVLIALVVLTVVFVLLDAVLEVVDDMYYDLELGYLFYSFGLMLVAAIVYNMFKVTNQHGKYTKLMYILCAISAYVAAMFVNPSAYDSGTFGIVVFVFWWLIKIGLIFGFLYAIYATKSFVAVLSYFTLVYAFNVLTSDIIPYDVWLIIRIALRVGVFVAALKFVKTKIGLTILFTCFFANFLAGIMRITTLSDLIDIDYQIKYIVYLILGFGGTFYLTHATHYLDKVKAAILLD